jgi:hypothetical protein
MRSTSLSPVGDRSPVCRDKLVELGEAEQARRAHFDFFTRLVELAGTTGHCRGLGMGAAP